MTSTTARTRFPQYKIVSAREPATFWRKNVIAVVILLRVFVRMSYWRKQLSYQTLEVLSFCDWEGLTSIEQ